MKSNVIIVFLIISCQILSSQTRKKTSFPIPKNDVFKSISIESGGLADALTSIEKQTITKLKIKGNIDARDFKILRDNMPKLAYLDISEVYIKSYSGDLGTSCQGENLYYQEDEIPECALNTTGAIPELKYIKLPITIDRISSYAFSNILLDSITIPDFVKHIGFNAFRSCSLKNIVIPASVDTLEEGAFSINDFSSITIPESVKYIGSKAIYSNNLTSIYIKSKTPLPIENDSFGEINYTNCTLYIPKGSKKAYREADNWKYFVNITEQ